jgi:hypothetical protein
MGRGNAHLCRQPEREHSIMPGCLPAGWGEGVQPHSRTGGIPRERTSWARARRWQAEAEVGGPRVAPHSIAGTDG